LTSHFPFTDGTTAANILEEDNEYYLSKECIYQFPLFRHVVMHSV
jgi:hypothetical protein